VWVCLFSFFLLFCLWVICVKERAVVLDNARMCACAKNGMLDSS
jgi:hypothetical protein